MKCVHLGIHKGVHTVRTSADDPGVEHPFNICKAGAGNGKCFPNGNHPTGTNCSTSCPMFVDPDAPITLKSESFDLPAKFSGRVVCTLAVGKQFQALLDVARPTFQSYAARCKADYAEIRLDASTYAQGEKFRINHLFDAGYSQVLFLDSDAIIMPTAPDLFELVPPEYAVAIHDDVPQLPNSDWVDIENARITDSQGWNRIPRTCWNTGVMLLRDRRAIDVPDKPIPTTQLQANGTPQSHFIEQCTINANIHRHGLKVYPLGVEWNDQWWKSRSLPERGSFVYHWSSAPAKVRLAEMIARRDGKPVEVAQPRSEFAPCANLGEVIRTDICAPCHGSKVQIRGCSQFGECAPRRYKQVGQPHICDRQCQGFSGLVQLQPR